MIEQRKLQKLFFYLNNSSNEPKTSLKRLATNSKVQKQNRFMQLFFPTRSRIKPHQPTSSANKQTIVPLKEQVTQLNQRATDVQNSIEHSISSLNSQRLEYLTSLDEKTRDLERAAAAFEYSSSKHLKQELDKTRKLSYMFKLAIILCLSLFSFMLGYMIIQLIRDKGIL